MWPKILLYVTNFDYCTQRDYSCPILMDRRLQLHVHMSNPTHVFPKDACANICTKRRYGHTDQHRQNITPLPVLINYIHIKAGLLQNFWSCSSSRCGSLWLLTLGTQCSQQLAPDPISPWCWHLLLKFMVPLQVLLLRLHNFLAC